MKKLELLLGVIFLFGLLLFIFNIPGATIGIVLSTLTISMIYCYFGFALFNNIRLRKIFKKESYKGISTLKIIFSVLTGLAISALVIGIMFKIQRYPGATVTIWTGLIGTFIALGLSLIKIENTNSEPYRNIVKRSIIWLIPALILILVPDKSIISFKYRDQPQVLKAFEKAWADPTNMELWNEVDNEINKSQMGNEYGKNKKEKQ